MYYVYSKVRSISRLEQCTQLDEMWGIFALRRFPNWFECGLGDDTNIVSTVVFIGRSVDMRTKSKQLLAKNLQQTQVSKCHLQFLLSEALFKFCCQTVTILQAFFDKLKAFIDFLSLPNYSKEEVRHKRALADRFLNPKSIIDLKSGSTKKLVKRCKW